MTAAAPSSGRAMDLAHAPAFIESQFPVSKLSKESYKERSAVAGQTLTALGKWWGRKPLVLVRAAVLGLLLPATDDPAKDRETFLALMTMDDDGLLRRLRGSIPVTTVYGHLTGPERERALIVEGDKPAWRRGMAAEEKKRLQRLAFRRMGYDEKLEHCLRPEELDGPSPEVWARINAHLGTQALSLPELVRELGDRRFGHVPRVGDTFCGSGAIPFEAARIGCDAYGSDLNPVAALLTWAAFNIVGGSGTVTRVQQAQDETYRRLCERVNVSGIERGDDGWIADAYLYCNEVVDPITGWRVPLAPSWIVAKKPLTVMRLRPNALGRKLELEVVPEGTAADEDATWFDGVSSPYDAEGRRLGRQGRTITSFAQLKGAQGLRRWRKDQFEPEGVDDFQEALYCVRWKQDGGSARYFAAPTADDLAREDEVRRILLDSWVRWRHSGYLPTRPVEEGQANTRPLKGRGWTHWHHFYNPRQLVLGGWLGEVADASERTIEEQVGLLLAVGRYADYNSRLSRWKVSQGGGIGGGMQTFFNPSLITPIVNYSCRTIATLQTTICADIVSAPLAGSATVELSDARAVSRESDLWITDPGYADTVNYEEFSEFFLAWYEKRLPKLFPDWYTDSKRALAVRGKGESFRQAMVECYRRLASLMPDNGFQIVMFTHQDAEVWSDVALILWAAGLQVTAAWTIATETESAGIKQGNYVQGTVLLVLRKRRGNPRGDLADIFPEVQAEVRRQLRQMLDLDPKEDPNFGDADYQLAAYAAALRVLTGYAAVDEIDVEKEIYRTRARGERSPLTDLIEKAVKIASDYLVPDGLDGAVWRKMGPEERLYLKGVEVEAHGEYREGVYQEFARGFGVGEYRFLLQSDAANQTRLRTPSEFRDRGRDPGAGGFAGSLLRQVLFAVHVTAREEDPRAARTYLADTLSPMGYWDTRQTILALLKYLGERPAPVMVHWAKDAEAARLLYGYVQNDSV